MIFLFEILIYLILFTVSVIVVVKNGPVDGIFFYPKPVQDRVLELGLTDKNTVKKRSTIYMILILIGIIGFPLLFIAGWNQVTDFKTAFLQALILLEVMNWYDAIVIDFVWVRNSKFWIIPGTEDLPYAKSLKQIIVRRSLATIMYVPIAAGIGWLALLVR